VHKLRAGALAALIQRYSVVDSAASAASRLGSFMHLLGGNADRAIRVLGAAL
jgi:hypothetical protein